MKKYLLHILLFFGIVAIVDVGFGLVCDWLQHHAKGGMTKRIQQTAFIQKADVVVMGSSRAHHHYVSSILADSLGMTAYNAGVDGNGIVLASGLYELMAERYSPKVILYDVEPAFDINVYAEDGNNTRYIGWLRPFVSNSGVCDIVKRVDPSEQFKTMSALFRYNSKAPDLVKDMFAISDYTEDGFAPMYGEMKTEPVKNNGGGPSQIDTLKINMLEEFVAKLSKSNTRLILMASPKYGAMTSEIFNPVKAICNKYGVEFWDFYCTTEFQKLDYFKEPMHLNEQGATAFSYYLAYKLKADKQKSCPEEQLTERSGKGRIRTPGTLRPTTASRCCNKPLCHLSKNVVQRYNFYLK